MDSATGLLYVGNGQYYDPATGRFLTRDVYPNNPNPYVPSGDPTGALFAPLVLVGLIYGKKKKKSKFDYFVIVLFVAVGVGMGLSACAPANPPAPATSPSLPPPIVTIETITPYPLSTPDANKCNNGYGCTAYLTFDDGPDPSITPQIGLLLQAKGVRATFFLTGADVSGWIRILSTCDPSLVPSEWANKEVAALVKATGHAIGIHGWFHGAEALPQYFWNSQFFDPETYITQEIQTLNQIGLEPDPLLRAPGGQFPADVISGYENWYYYGWDVNSFDGPSTSADQIVNNVIGQLETKGLPNKPIILLHSIWPSTLESIANPQFDLIGRLKDLGYTQFDKLPRAGDNPGYPPNGEIYTIG